MKRILMNKNTPVYILEYSESAKGFTKVYETLNEEYAPLIVLNNNEICTVLSSWLKNRSIPDNRYNLDILLKSLNVTYPMELLDKSFALSLSDQYWLKPANSTVTWENINYFDNEFDSLPFIEGSFSKTPVVLKSLQAYQTPNNTLNGTLPKAWNIEEGKRILIKGSSLKEQSVVFHEWLATKICQRLGFNNCPYKIDIIKGKVVSKCECFIDKDTEFVPASHIFKSTPHSYTNIFEENDFYIKILEEKGIKNANQKIENMYILDFIILNEDRHLNNFGIIRNVDNLKWLDVAPIFDNGKSLEISISDKIVTIPSICYLAGYETEFSNLLKTVKDFKRIDLSKLNGICEEYEKILNQYQNISLMSKTNIQGECAALNFQIHQLDKYISEKYNTPLKYDYNNKYFKGYTFKDLYGKKLT